MEFQDFQKLQELETMNKIKQKGYEKDKDFMAPRLESLVAIYKKITTRDLQFEFKTDHTFYVTKK